MSKISVSRLYPVDHQGGSVRARGTFSYDGVFDIAFALISGRDGMFVALPSHTYEKEGNTKRKYDVWCTDDEVRADITDTVIDAYNKAQSGETNEERPEKSNENSIPF